MSSQKSIWRFSSKTFLVISAISVLALIFCSEPKNESYTLSFMELDSKFPSYYPDVELTSQGSFIFHPLDDRSGIWIGPDGDPYSGEENRYSVISDLPTFKNVYEHGRITRTEYYRYDDTGTYLDKGVSEYSINSSEELITHFFTTSNSDTLRLFIYRVIVDGSLETETFYFPNGQVMSSQSFLWDYSTPERKDHGLKSRYDEEGNLFSQELYENGTLIETIK